jgi:hypothetical protein
MFIIASFCASTYRNGHRPITRMLIDIVLYEGRAKSKAKSYDTAADSPCASRLPCFPFLHSPTQPFYRSVWAFTVRNLPLRARKGCEGAFLECWRMDRTKIGEASHILKFKDIQSRKRPKCQVATDILKFKDIQSRKGPMLSIKHGARKRDGDLSRSERQLLDHRSERQTTSLVSMLGTLDYQRLYGGYLALHRRQVPQRLLSELSNEQISSLDSVMRDYEKKLRSK